MAICNTKSKSKTAINNEVHWFDIQFGIYGIELIFRQIGLNRLGYKTELPILFLVVATAGYSGVSGAIANGMEVVELFAGESIRQQKSELARSRK